MEEFKFIEPKLIKAGSNKLRLGEMRYAPKVDCRVLSEDTYQELKKAYDLVCDSKTSDTDSKQLNIPDISNLLIAFSKRLEKSGEDGSCLTYKQEVDNFLAIYSC